MENNNNTVNDFHAGALIKNYIDSKKISKSWLARALQVDDSVIIYYQRKPSIQSTKLLQLSHVLKHNFFADISALLPSSYSTDAPVDDSKDQLIAELQKEIDRLKTREAVLMEMRR